MFPKISDRSQIGFSRLLSVTLTETDHVDVADYFFEVGVSLVALNLFRLQLLSCTLHLYLGALHLKQLHPFQIPQTPEQHLHTHTQKYVTSYKSDVSVSVDYVCDMSADSESVFKTSILKVLRTGRTPSGMA